MTRAALVALLLAYSGLGLVACGLSSRTAEAHLRGALDVVALVVDPASRLAAESCAARQEAVASLVESGKLAHAEGVTQIGEIRARCREARNAFEAMRAQHERARVLVDQGALTEANEVLERIRAEWSQLSQEPP